ncbi:ribosome-inactivating family protein [Lentzea atacamensis]|uniref:ribosome-inactivating family protein n=1 Tax=Lentzea atacamensis TaxID=531938 RepID=UPI001474DDB9|nr:ribosome-inactivating family protein [Lentzea atacamensis]
MGARRRVGRRRRRAAAIAVAAFSLAVGLLGPLGSAPSAHAEDGNPTFRIGVGDYTHARDDYWGFINGVRAAVDEGRDRSVPDTNVPVDHTNPYNRYYFQVDIHAWGGGPNDFVRLQIRRSDLYVVGWWSNDNWYNRVEHGDTAPTSRWQNGEFRGVYGMRDTAFNGDYGSLQNVAGASRYGMHFNNSTLNDAVWALLNARGNNTAQAQALGVLRLAQFVSEAARFRPISDFMVTAATGGDLVLDGRIVDLQNNWGALSGRFNWLRSTRNSDANPIHAYGRNERGGVSEYVLWTAALYANYILNTAKG